MCNTIRVKRESDSVMLCPRPKVWVGGIFLNQPCHGAMAALESTMPRNNEDHDHFLSYSTTTRQTRPPVRNYCQCALRTRLSILIALPRVLPRTHEGLREDL